ncbi:DUF6049 family protein [Nocardia panacis]|uniref:DUF6049 family protein n=1 Tax=Nocardia panacis TaxID=2340916 RepID=UPI001EF12092|nr:DUF6049 family protein [Nocardia panacis]
MTRGPRTPVRLIVAVLAMICAVVLPAATNIGQARAETLFADQNSANAPTAPKFLKLSLDSVTPTAVTANSDPLLTVSGTVTNIGDRVVDDVSIRIQRGAAIANPSSLRATLRYDQVNYEVVGPFEDIAQRMQPGQRKQFTLSIALRQSGRGSSLDITKPGVYPLLLNVNGEPAYGTQARLDDARFLLPVLGLPANPGGSDTAPVPPPEGAAVATTLIWPLADRPRMVAGQPGTVDRRVELVDDELAASFGKGGRLDQLVGALESVVGTAGGREKSTVASSVCVAVDPDLLLTAQAMTKGYRVLASPSDPGGATRQGTGADQAQTWLDRMRALAASMCTVALPFGQVDLAALAAANDPDLSARALNAPADIVDAVLATHSVRGVSLPDSGSIDSGAGLLLRGHGFTTAVLADSAVAPLGAGSATQAVSQSLPESTAPELVRLPDTGGPVPPQPEPTTTPGAAPPAPADSALHVATFDIWSATALAAIGSNPPTPSFTPSKVRYDVAIDSRAARLQDALGAISWPALEPQANRPRSLLLMPPQQWGANRDEAITLLRHLDLLARNGLSAPRPFAELVAGPPDAQPYELDYLPQAQQDATPDRFVLPVRDQATRLTALQRAMVEVPEVEPTPRNFLTPLRDDLIRTMTLSDRRANDSAQPDTFAQRRLDQTTDTVDTLYRGVTVLPPGGVYTLASEQSPLLLVARNTLPVTIRIRFQIAAPPETKITDIREQQLPPNGTRSFQIPTVVTDSRNLVIPISLTTPDGVALGTATSVSVRSNAYGQALAIITGCAGLVLLLLVGRRLWRRFRKQPDPADEGLDTDTRRRVNRYRRARKRVLRQQEQTEQQGHIRQQSHSRRQGHEPMGAPVIETVPPTDRARESRKTQEA